MGGTKDIAHVIIVGRVLVLVADNEADGTSSRLAFKHPAQQFHLVLLITAGGNTALAGTSAVEFLLNEIHVDVNACRHTVDNPSDGCSVALAKCGQPEYGSKSVTHVSVCVWFNFTGSLRNRLFLHIRHRSHRYRSHRHRIRCILP